jgi:hypothetical protein
MALKVRRPQPGRLDAREAAEHLDVAADGSFVDFLFTTG